MIGTKYVCMGKTLIVCIGFGVIHGFGHPLDKTYPPKKMGVAL